MHEMSDAAKIREIILNVKTPILIKKELQWDCLKIPFKKWCEVYNQELLNKAIEFDYAPRKHSERPQWEKNRKKKQMTVLEFYKNANNSNNEFFKHNYASINYKRLPELPTGCRKNVNFTELGFPEICEEEGTYWLTSTGGHTPCHYDTYGCNIVIQIYGKKRWLLFPPETPLSPVRIPYEESSVYCSENFYSPKNLQQFENCKDNCYECILEPGNILVVPKGWWHFVENLETALTINHWLPLVEDSDAQISECIVKYLIDRFTENESNDAKRNILNPNELDHISVESDTLSILNMLIKKKSTTELSRPSKKNMSVKQYHYQYLTNEEVDKLIKNLSIPINYLVKLSSDAFNDRMKSNVERFEVQISDPIDELLNIKIMLINSICNPAIIKQVKDSLYANYR